MKKFKIVALAFLLVLSLTACTDTGIKTSQSDQPKKNKSVSKVDNSSSSKEDAKPKKEDIATDDEDSISFKINETTDIGDWEVTVTKFKFQDEIKADYGSFTPEEGNKYLVISALITNVGEESNEFLPMFNLGDKVSCNVVYNNKYEYSASTLLGHDKGLNASILNPLIDKKGIIAFAVPDKVSTSDKPLTFNLMIDDKTYSCKLEQPKK